CVAALGTEGCGFEQHLEVALKALWPSADNRIQFLGDANNFGKLGHGDNENQGFLRSDPIRGLSVVAIVLVTDEEDCSRRDSSFLRPSSVLDPNDPAEAQLLQQGLNVRCNFNERDLFETTRYVNGFKALRPGDENLVVFGAIVGVPPETVNQQVLANLIPQDAASRDQFYRGILNHTLMQPVVDTNDSPDPADDMMKPSCDTARGLAFPPRRIVEVARGFGENGIVQSICQEDLGPAIDAIVDRIADQLGAVCLPRPLVRDGAGLVGCDMVWELPSPGVAPSGTPTQCGDPGFPFLLPVDQGQENLTARGGMRCNVAQLAVRDAQPIPTEIEAQQITLNDGWYYDDFSEDVAKGCKAAPRQRIAFTASATPPTGVSVKLECLEATLPNCSAGKRSADASGVGDPCLTHVVPEAGFDPRAAYIETNTPDCGGGLCIVHNLEGDPRKGCIPDAQRRCATTDEVELSVYCTCRCDAPAGYAQCACPDGFSCVTELSLGGPDVSGGYCVRDGTSARSTASGSR
ncbi:MAG TPA: hypothetical protein VK509_12480, partial [Polyangiales bacterium]|nr:hypothetical protein [Polyangiales bacterium]